MKDKQENVCVNHFLNYSYILSHWLEIYWALLLDFNETSALDVWRHIGETSHNTFRIFSTSFTEICK